MKQRTSSLPMVVIIAVIALVLGSIGTSVAAPALTKGKVKKIATKVIKKQAPKLTVASAGNATNLNGKPSTTYLDRVAFTSVDSNGADSVPLPVGPHVQVLGPLSLTVPNGVSFAHVTGNVSVAGNTASSYFVYAQQDDVCGLTGVGYTNRVFDEFTAQNATTFDFVFPVTPGVHTYRLCALSGAAAAAYNRTLTVETIATGATGGSAITKPSSGGGAADGDTNLATAD